MQNPTVDLIFAPESRQHRKSTSLLRLQLNIYWCYYLGNMSVCFLPLTVLETMHDLHNTSLFFHLSRHRTFISPRLDGSNAATLLHRSFEANVLSPVLCSKRGLQVSAPSVVSWNSMGFALQCTNLSPQCPVVRSLYSWAHGEGDCGLNSIFIQILPQANPSSTVHVLGVSKFPHLCKFCVSWTCGIHIISSLSFVRCSSRTPDS